MFDRINRFFLPLTFLIAWSGAACAAPVDDYYEKVANPQPTLAADGKIEVLEFFWYGCPHCYTFEPHVAAWLADKPEDVEFRRMPAVLNKSWIPHAKAFYTAEKLGVMDRIHGPLFDALHKDREKVYTDDQLRDFFIEQGVDAADFDRVYDSSEVDTRVKRAFILAQRYRITGVPMVIVNGKYMTSGTIARSFENLLMAVDELVNRERRGGSMQAQP